MSSREPLALKASCRLHPGSPAALPCRPRSHLAWGPSPEPQQGPLRDEKCQGYLIIPSNSCDPAAVYKPIYLPSPPPSPGPAQPGLQGGGAPRQQQACSAASDRGGGGSGGPGRPQCSIRHSEAFSRVRLARCGGSRHLKLGDNKLQGDVGAPGPSSPPAPCSPWWVFAGDLGPSYQLGM